jgi:hypothetical protein
LVISESRIAPGQYDAIGSRVVVEAETPDVCVPQPGPIEPNSCSHGPRPYVSQSITRKRRSAAIKAAIRLSSLLNCCELVSKAKFRLVSVSIEASKAPSPVSIFMAPRNEKRRALTTVVGDSPLLADL